jgi:signal transduction histidine kinase
MFRRYALLDRRHEHWILASMLLVLHAALDAGFDDGLSGALMTAHLGLFFLWQPIWQKDQRLDPQAILVILVLVGGMLLLLDWWIIFGWLVLLIGIVAGRSFSTRQERYVYMLSLAFLISELLVNCTARLFLAEVPAPGITQAFRVGLYLLPAVLYAIPPITVPQREPFPVDFFRGIIFALMTALLAVFSVLMTVRLGIDYPLALVATLIALSLFLFFLAWITTPGAGSIGLLSVWEKSVLNIGTPFEVWLGNIANLASQRTGADEFLEAAIDELVDIPWVSGAAWRSDSTNGLEGRRSPHALAVETGPLEVTLYTERSFSTALLIHCRLLIQVLGHFYVAKRRENEQASEAHLRAIYATGARVTHDIKNLLQSLQTMAGALHAAGDPGQQQRGFNLLKRRLPDIVRRLQVALDKLQRPGEQQQGLMPLARWWPELRERFGDSDVMLEADLRDPDARLPSECFDSVVDNLVDNARHKIAAGAARAIRIRVDSENRVTRVTVSDDGAAIAPAIARDLLVRPVPSITGLGIGLYQSARQAQMAGCELVLAENRDGEVRFELSYADEPAQREVTEADLR